MTYNFPATFRSGQLSDFALEMAPINFPIPLGMEQQLSEWVGKF
jgi:hypothetical protein